MQLNRHGSSLITSKWVSVSSGFKLHTTKNESAGLRCPALTKVTATNHNVADFNKCINTASNDSEERDGELLSSDGSFEFEILPIITSYFPAHSPEYKMLAWYVPVQNR